MDFERELEEFKEQLKKYHIPRWAELPDVDLYMDQVVSVLEKNLYLFARGDNKLITPSMINNYVKQGLVPPPIKKRYGKKHLAYLFVVCLLKQVLTIQEIKGIIDEFVTSGENHEAYDYYCEMQEHAFCNAINFNNDDMRMIHLSLQLAVNALAYKIYAQKIIEIKFGNPDKKSKKD